MQQVSISDKCDFFYTNRQSLEKEFKKDKFLSICAAIYTINNRVINEENIKVCKSIIHTETNMFSSFKDIGNLVFATKLSLYSNAEDAFNIIKQINKQLSNFFVDSPYLPMTAFTIYDFASEEKNYLQIINKTKQIYKLMKEKHPFLTSSDDCSLAALLAFRKGTAEEIISISEQYYVLLEKYFGAGNSLQSLSNSAALANTDISVKCKKIIEINENLKLKGCKIGNGAEIAVLGMLSEIDNSAEYIAKLVLEGCNCLSEYKNFSKLWCPTNIRFLYASLLAYTNETSFDIDADFSEGATKISLAQQLAVNVAIGACMTSGSNI